MTTKNISQWKIFRQFHENLNPYTGVHFADKDKAYLIRNDDVYQIALTQGCFKLNFNLRGIKALSSGVNHVVVLDNDGYVYCYGSNTNGELGAGHCEAFKEPYKTNLKAIDQISCGESFTIALSKCDELWFWGTLRFTQHMTDNWKRCFTTPTLIELPGDPVPKFISTGAEHIAITCENKKIYTWGKNEEGELGLGHRNFVRQPELLSFEVEFNFAVCGNRRTVFITEDGSLYMSDSMTNNTIICVSETNNILGLAAHWRSNLFIAVDECGFFYAPFRIDDRTVLQRKALEDILDGFIDVGTPSVHWLSKSCIASKTSAGITSIECVGNIKPCASHVDVAHLYNSERFSDIKIKLSDGFLYAHKVIVTSKSKIFNKAVTETDPELKLMDVSNMNASAYRIYIKYLYTGSVEFDNVYDIVEVYFMGEEDENEELKRICLKKWKDEIKKENVIRAFEKAFLQKLRVLLDACGPFLHQNLQYILNSEEYNSLSVEVKLSLLTVAATRHTVS